MKTLEGTTSRWSRVALAAGAAVAALSLGLTQSGAQTPTYDLTLTGDEEVPPVMTASEGDFVATIDNDSVDYTLTATGESLTMAHFHFGAAGTNGPVVAFLFGPNPAGVGSINETGSVTAADLVGPFAGDWNAFVTALNTGQIYVNVHNIAYPSGALRAQVPGGRVPPGAFVTATTAPATTVPSTATASATMPAGASTAKPSATPKPPSTGEGMSSGGDGLNVWLIVATGIGVAGAAGAAFVTKRQ